MANFKCWSPENGSEEDDARVLTESWMDAEEAATKYAEDKFYDWEQPSSPFEIFVKECNENGEDLSEPLRKFTITVEYSPEFWCTEKREDRP